MNLILRKVFLKQMIDKEPIIFHIYKYSISKSQIHYLTSNYSQQSPPKSTKC